MKIKKKIFMMAMAASMVVPSNLALVANVATPVLATNGSMTVTISGISYEVTPWNDDLFANNIISFTQPIYINSEVNLDLTGKEITTSAKYGFIIGANGKLNFTGSGVINSSNSTDSVVEIIRLEGEGAGLSIGQTTLAKNDLESASNFTYGITVGSQAFGSTITATGTTINTDGGISVNGNMIETQGKMAPQITLKNVNLDNPGIGIYQAGYSTFEVFDSFITSASSVNNSKNSDWDRTGIEIRAGKLTLNNTEVQSGIQDYSSTPNSNGSTSKNVGVAVAQHKTKQAIEVIINNGTKISGDIAVLISNPQNNSNTDLGKVSLNISDSVLKGDDIDLGYKTSVPSLTLFRNIFVNNKIENLTSDADYSLTNFTKTPISQAKIEVPTGDYTSDNLPQIVEIDGVSFSVSEETLNEEDLKNDLFTVTSSLKGNKGTLLVKATDNNLSYVGEKEIEFNLKDNSNTSGSTTTAPVIPTPSNKTFSASAIVLADGPYTVSAGNIRPSVSVSGLSSSEYSVSYSLSTDENGNYTGGEVIVTGRGDYAGCVQSKTYVIVDDRKDSVDISFTIAADDNPNSDEDTTISLAIPTDYLPTDDNGETLPITNETLSEALTAQSDQQKVEGTNETPSYEYTVTGLENSNEKKPPVVKVKVNNESMIRLILQQVSSFTQPESGFVEMSEVSMLSDDEIELEAANNEVVIYASLNELDANNNLIVTKDEVETYIKNKPQYSNAQVQDFEDQDFRKALELGKDIALSDDGFFEISAEVKTATKPSGGSSGGSSSNKPATTPKPEEPAKPVLGKPTSMYRLYNRLTGEHLYTTDKAERDNLLTSDTWKDEGEGWIAPEVSDFPVYRLLNPNTTDHHYTTDTNEYETLQTLGWVGEGIAFFSADTESGEHVILHRVYNPNEKGAGSHHYTVDENEKEALVKLGWIYEGTAWSGLKSE